MVKEYNIEDEGKRMETQVHSFRYGNDGNNKAWGLLYDRL